MNKPIPNKIRCKKCMHFEELDKNVGICKRRSYDGRKIFVRPTHQIENCFQERDVE